MVYIFFANYLPIFFLGLIYEIHQYNISTFLPYHILMSIEILDLEDISIISVLP
jgi:hypothetical protein